jgi:hypothetical protein
MVVIFVNYVDGRNVCFGSCLGGGWGGVWLVRIALVGGNSFNRFVHVPNDI